MSAKVRTLGHIGYGYLYTNFGPQFRYTTPSFGGFKFTLEVAEPYQISMASAQVNGGKQNTTLNVEDFNTSTLTTNTALIR